MQLSSRLHCHWDDNNSLCTLLCTTAWSLALGNSLSEMAAFLLCLPFLPFCQFASLPVQGAPVCRSVHKTTQILCLYSSWLAGTVKCSYDHHQPSTAQPGPPRLSEHFELWAGISSSNILLAGEVLCSLSALTTSNQQGQSGIILCNYHLLTS